MATVLKRNRLMVWKDVIFALFVREIRSRFSDKLGISWAVLEPISFVFLLSYIRGRINGGEVHSIPIFAFMMYGMLLVQLFLTVFNATSNAISKNRALYAFRQVQPISSILAIGFFELFVFISVVFSIYSLMFLLNIEIRMDDPLDFILCVFFLWLFSLSLGIVFGLAKCFVVEVQKIQAVITRPIFFISGVFFSLQDFAKDYWHYFNWNPILHAIELARQASYSSFGAQGVSLSFLAMCTLGMLSLSLACYHVAWKKAISR